MEKRKKEKRTRLCRSFTLSMGSEILQRIGRYIYIICNRCAAAPAAVHGENCVRTPG